MTHRCPCGREFYFYVRPHPTPWGPPELCGECRYDRHQERLADERERRRAARVEQRGRAAA